MVLRSDEVANLDEEQRDRRFRGLVKGAVGLGASLGGASISSRILPFINEFVPVDLAIKGISKISPEIGEMLKQGQKMGFDVEEGLQFVKNKIENQPQDQRNLIEKYSPELHNFITKEMQGGRSSAEAAALAQMDTKSGNPFRKIIEKIVKENKAPWLSIIQSIYGDSQQKPSQPSSTQQQMQQSQQPQQGSGQASLMDILNRIDQKMGQR
jgi:hypothetical protein